MIIKESLLIRISIIILAFSLLTACSANAQPVTTTQAPGLPRVLAIESFLADIVRNVSGDRLVVDTLLPINSDPHSYQPAPRDVIKVANSAVLILNGGGIEAFVAPLLDNAGGSRLVIQASAGLTARPDPTGEHPEGDPHFWMDPNLIIKYVENIRDGLIQVDPPGSTLYNTNAAAYILQLQSLDAWIKEQVAQVPAGQRQLVTNHESLGYFAARYGFTVVGTVIPSISSDSDPSARELANLIDKIKASGARAIFMETGANINLAEQIAGETSARIVTDLYIHSVSDANGPAPTYIEMMKYNVTQIVNALK
jgi:ABC-type Zn uptake system ZnuABC Zn-binding protein ZnuA